MKSNKIQLNDRLFNVYKYLSSLMYEHCYKHKHISNLEFNVALEMIKGILDESSR